MLKECPECGSHSFEDNLRLGLRLCLKTSCGYSEPLLREKTQLEKEVDDLKKRISLIEERLR